MHSKITTAILGVALAVSAVAMVPAHAADYPEKPITVIYPWPAGDPTTGIMRTIGELVSKELGQPVVVNSVEGAGGAQALTVAASADADGYTLASNWVAAQVGAKLFNPSLPYDNDSFVPIAGVFGVPFTVTVGIDHPANTIAEFVDWAKQEGRTINFGVCAPQSVPRLVGEQFMKAAEVDYNPIPFNGGCGGDNMTGLLNGSLDVSVGIVPLINVFAGQIKHLGLLSDDPHPLAPDLETAQENGVTIGWGAAVLGWGGLVAPAGTPDEVVTLLQAAFSEVLQSEELKNELGNQAAILNFIEPEEFRALWVSSESLLAPSVEAIRNAQ